MKLYTEKKFDTYVSEYKEIITREVNSQTDSYILNVNIEEFTTYLLSKYLLDIPEILLEEVYADSIEKNVSGHDFPKHDFMLIDPGKTFRKEVIIFHIPYKGNVNLLQLVPNPYTLMSYEVNINIKEKCFLIEIIKFYPEPEKIKNQYNKEIQNLLCNYENIRKNCESFNLGLETFIRANIESRKQQVLQKNNLLASLGVKIIKKDDIPNTFSVSKPLLREKINLKPIVNEDGFKPEPALDENSYRQILKIINDVGKNFERMPSTYKGKSEEDIRDHILLILDPNFELGSAGGETFNKIGKTDISLRYDSSVVFIAECKYWKGEKSFLKTIDQLLGYLTWRNSKVAIINFVQNNEFSEILSKLNTITNKHPNFQKELQLTDETWFNYKFNLNDDKNRIIDLAVISFHLPKKNGA
ncbi:hypothetical protein [Leptospira wolbachii]|nr:hypothetical protein [Leptospira wolbachii]